VNELAAISESLLREHRSGIVTKQLHQKRIADALADIYGQIAVLSRVSAIFADQGVGPSGQERYIADTFCARAAHRVRSRFRHIERNDDDRMTGIAKLAYKRGEYGYALFKD
jgi:acyl-CoA dehydrogenase family protein 9